MIKVSFIFLILFFSLFCEIIVGSFGITAPVLACVIFYISVNYGWKLSLMLSLITGLLIDSLFGRHSFYTPYLLIIITLFGTYWLHKGVVKIARMQMFPGIVIGFIYSFPMIALQYYKYDKGVYLFVLKILSIFISIILAALILPFIVLLLDSFSEKFGEPLYTEAKKRLYENS